MRLQDPLPESVKVGGHDYPVFTDFRDWIAFDELIGDPELDDQTKANLMLGWYREDPPKDGAEAIKALVWFFAGGESPKPAGGSGTQKPVYSYAEDAELIFASFRSAGGYLLDLESVPSLHWWKFRAMLLHISPETAIGRVMGLRATDDKHLTKAQRRLKQLCELGQKGTASAGSDEELIARAKDARRRAEMARLP